MSRRKYFPIYRIHNMAEFETAINGKNPVEWFTWRGKTTHYSVLISLQYRVLQNAIYNGDIWIAKKKEEFYSEYE